SMLFVIYKVRPKFTLCYTIKPVLFGGIASWVLRVPFRYSMITGLGYLFQADISRSMKYKIAILFYRASLRVSTKVFFQNDDDKELFLSQKIVVHPNRTVLVNGSGVNMDRYDVFDLPPEPVFLFI